jgi:archaetidylinositol phosphate synthase
MLDRLRPLLKRILNPIAKKVGINPNIITIISLLISVIAAMAIGNKFLITGAILVFISGFLDVLDGAVARYHGKDTKFGAVLDSTIDRFSDTIIYTGFIFGGYIEWFIGILAIHSGITVSYVRASAESKGLGANVGIAERAVRIIIIIIALILGQYYSTLYLQWLIIVLVILSYITVIHRLYHVWKYQDCYENGQLIAEKKNKQITDKTTSDKKTIEEKNEKNEKKLNKIEEKDDMAKYTINASLDEYKEEPKRNSKIFRRSKANKDSENTINSKNNTNIKDNKTKRNNIKENKRRKRIVENDEELKEIKTEQTSLKEKYEKDKNKKKELRKTEKKKRKWGLFKRKD